MLVSREEEEKGHECGLVDLGAGLEQELLDYKFVSTSCMSREDNKGVNSGQL